MKLRARWLGSPPRTGDYLMSPTRPRFAYRVLEVQTRDAAVRWDSVAKSEYLHLTILVDRMPAADVPKHARVHPW